MWEINLYIHVIFLNNGLKLDLEYLHGIRTIELLLKTSVLATIKIRANPKFSKTLDRFQLNKWREILKIKKSHVAQKKVLDTDVHTALYFSVPCKFAVQGYLSGTTIINSG